MSVHTSTGSVRTEIDVVNVFRQNHYEREQMSSMCPGKITTSGGERKQRHFITCGILRSFESKML
ncbi:MAG: hypothetical protein LBD67_09385 [Candidatus Accumulibacter sp.]|nr:hypothetical protein [Accumulibacter sp.]